MSKLFTMARQTGRQMMARVAALLAMGAAAWPDKTECMSLAPVTHHWPMPNQRNSTAAADKRFARRRRNIAKRRG